MQRLNNIEVKNKNIELYLTEQAVRDVRELNLSVENIYKAASKLFTRTKKRYTSYYCGEYNILYLFEIDECKLFLHNVRIMSICDNKIVVTDSRCVRNVIKEPVFLRSYDNRTKVYLERSLHVKMKNESIPPHYISFFDLALKDGGYSMFRNGIVIDFLVKEKNFYIVDLLVPDFVNFGLLVYPNKL